MKGIYNYIPETNHISRVHRVAAVLYLQSVLHVMYVYYIIARNGSRHSSPTEEKYYIIIIIIIIIIILVITCMKGIYNYIPETNHISRIYTVAAVLYLQSVLHVMLLPP
jgi:peptidoglycan biosynthesis protein MviN/MurJ (putative lipid II flippase)